MWEIYDALIDGIPDDIYVESCSCGLCWTAVRSSEGNIGIAMTTDDQSRPHSVTDFSGMSLKETAGFVKSWNFIEASFGIAAINSWYNSPARLDALNCRQNSREFCTFGLDLTGKTVGMIGHLKHDPELFADVKNLYIMEKHPQNGDYPDSACEFLIPECDVVVITGSAFINKTLPRLLELGKNAKVIIAGPSTPMAPQLLNYGIYRLAGVVPQKKEELWQFVTSGSYGSPHAFGERFNLDITM